MTTRAEAKRIFTEHGLSPKKWMGQNLLVDDGYLREIAHTARPVPGEPIVEIGAGLGALTQELAGRGAEVWALEVDSGFFRVLEERFAGSEQVHLIHADALKFDFRGLAERLGTLKVVANLPYNISSRIIFRCLEDRDIFSSLTILLQKEVADRLTASPGTKEYGILSVLLGVNASVVKSFDIPPHAFFPRPKITSTLVRVEIRHPPPVQVTNPALLTDIVKTAFGRRRKTLRNTLKNLRSPGVTPDLISDAAASCAIDLSRRPETLSPGELGALADAIEDRITG